jgi:hypothetical protein
VFTQTRPWPPPGAGVALVAVSAFVPAEPVAGAVEVEGLAEVFGLKKSASVFFAGEGDGATVGEAAAVPFVLRPCFSVGEGDASAAVPAEGEVAAVVFALCVRFSAGEGDASLAAAGEAVALASAFLCDRCLPGDGDAVGEGDCASTKQVAARPMTSKKARIFVFMTGSLNKKAPKMED